MEKLVYGCVLILLTLMSFPSMSDAFSRRSSSSEVTQSQGVTTPVRTSTTDDGNVSAHAVPEPPILLFLSIAVGAFAFGAVIRRYRRQS
jgi:hypothetical protein